jgi:hypothetical protein
MEDGSKMGLQLCRQQTVLLLSLERIRRALETPQRVHKEDITRATFATETDFPDTRARINYDAIFCAIERMPATGLVMW